MRIFTFITSLTIIISLASVIVFFVFNSYGIFKNPTINKVVLSLLIIMPILLIITHLVGYSTYSKLNSIIYTTTVIWFGWFLYIFCASIILGIVYFFIKHTPQSILTLICISTVVVISCTIGYAVWNASHPVVTTMKVTIPNLSPLWHNKKIILFSDTHLGLVRGEKFTEKVVALVNEQHPDLVLMAGDMIDGPAIPYETFSAPFKKINSTYGVFYTPGNHEWYNVEPEKFIGVMKHLTKALIDEKFIVNGTQIVGINYGMENSDATQARLARTGFDPSIPSIAIIHDPKNNDALIEKGVSLVVSGHTHCGQFWPFTSIVKKIYKDKTHGVRQLGDQATITTCGIGTAFSPFRIGNTPEIVVIEIQ